MHPALDQWPRGPSLTFGIKVGDVWNAQVSVFGSVLAITAGRGRRMMTVDHSRRPELGADRRRSVGLERLAGALVERYVAGEGYRIRVGLIVLVRPGLEVVALVVARLFITPVRRN